RVLAGSDEITHAAPPLTSSDAGPESIEGDAIQSIDSNEPTNDTKPEPPAPTAAAKSDDDDWVVEKPDGTIAKPAPAPAPPVRDTEEMRRPQRDDSSEPEAPATAAADWTATDRRSGITRLEP